LEEIRKLPCPTRGKGRTKIAELFADERCSQALLDSSYNRRREDGRLTGGRRHRSSGQRSLGVGQQGARGTLAAVRQEEERLGGIGGLSLPFLVFTPFFSFSFFFPYFLISFVLPFIDTFGG